MYRSKRLPARQAKNVGRYDSNTLYRPFSHFVLGGTDITGEHTSLTNPTIFDGEDVADFAPPSALTSPRMGPLELAEFLGVKSAEDAIEKAKSGEKK